MKITSQVKNLPRLPGVYLFENQAGKVIYVGKAIDLAQRVKSYFQASSQFDAKTKKMISEISSLSFIPVEGEFEALLLEAKLIKERKPKYNSKWKDDKSFLYILLTNEEYPRVLPARKKEAQEGEYFGPFPKAKTVRQVLTFLRRIFPYCSQKLSRKACFYSHLGLCQPCPSKIIKLESQKQKILKRKYLANISYLKKVLAGQSQQVAKKLEKEMKQASKKLDFEKAKKIKEQLEKLSYLTSPRTEIALYLENPNFLENQRDLEIKELERLLKPYFGKLSLSRIECFDVSNLYGRQATGAMAVFLQGVEEKRLYRRFRIRQKKRFDDLAMLQEIFKRRLAHPEWPLPDLFLVDGGKGQVGAVRKTLKTLKLSLPVIGLSKRFEQIVIPKAQGFVILRLPESSSALCLLRRIRDEAHRFAITYQRKLRTLII